MRRIVRTVLAAGLAGGLLTATGAGPAGADVGEVGGGAFGVFAELEPFQLDPVTIGPLPQVTLPPEGGGPFTDDAATVPLDAISGQINALSVETEGALGPAGFAASAAEALGIVLLDGQIEAEVLTAECVATEDEIEGGATITNLELPDDTLINDPEPNTEIDVLGFGTLFLNEQVVTENGITVNAFRMEIDVEELVTGTIIISQAECSVTPAVAPEPVVPPAEPVPAEVTFTG